MTKKWPPTKTIWAFCGFLAFLSIATSATGPTNSVLSLNENQVLYLFSTSAQVLAGIYGLTLTGFIFFRNELSREELEDDTLTDAVESLKQRYFTLLLFITGLVLLTILLSNLAISNEASGNTLANTLLINGGQSAFATSLIAIAYFIFDVISPRRIEIASRTLQNKVDPAHATAKGSLEDFLRNYNQIELLLADSGESYRVTSYATSQAPFQRRTSNSRLAEILFRNERIDASLFQRLRELITLRNSIIHGADPVVSQEIVHVSAQVLQELQAVLGADSRT